MFPFLAEMNSVDHTIDGIITEIRVQKLSQRVEFLRPQRTLGQQESDGLREYRVGRFPPCPVPQ